MRYFGILFIFIFGLSFGGLGVDLSLDSSGQLTVDGWSEELSLGLSWDEVYLEAGASLESEGLEQVSFGSQLALEPLRLGAEADFSLVGFEGATLEAGVDLGPVGDLGLTLSYDEAGFAGAELSLQLGVSAEGSGELGTSGVLLDFDEGWGLEGQAISLGLSFPSWEIDSVARFEEGGFASLEITLSFSSDALRIEGGCTLEPEGVSVLNAATDLAADAGSIQASFSWSPVGSWEGEGEISGEIISLRGNVSQADSLINWGLEVSLSLDAVELRAGLEMMDESPEYSAGLSLQGDAYSVSVSGSGDPAGAWELLFSLALTLEVSDGPT